MDLQTQRRLEDFLHLLEVRSYSLSNYVEIMDPPLRLCIEVLANYCILTLISPRDPLNKEAALLTLLSACQPEHFQGTPLRCFSVSTGLAVSFNLYPDASTQEWFALYLNVKKIISTAQKPKRL